MFIFELRMNACIFGDFDYSNSLNYLLCAKLSYNNNITRSFADDNGSTSSSNDERGYFTNDGSENYFPMMSAELANKLKYKFWA